MNTPQLLCGAIAVAMALTGCQRPATQADAKKAAVDVASGVKVETQKAAARARDGWLTTKIQSKFVADRDIKASDISVSSHDGVVILKGRVLNEPMRALAVAIAKNTDGVEQVIDQLNVTVAGPLVAPTRAESAPPAGAVATTGTAAPETPGAVAPAAPGTIDDARITSSIQSKYFLDDRIKTRKIEVDTNNGVVTLRGELENETERAEALLLARTTEGVKRVEDSLAVVATSPAPGADATLAERIQSTLAGDSQVKGARIEVTARNGVVLLDGTAPSPAAKQRALALARAADGVTQIVDRIRISRPAARKR